MNYLRIKVSILLLMIVQLGICAQSYTIKVSKGDIQFDKVKGYDIVHLPNAFFSGPDGAPMLPDKTLQYIIPIDKDVSKINIVSFKETVLEGTYLIYPKQPDQILGAEKENFVEPKSEFYGRNEFYPGKLIDHIQTGFMAGNRICSFSFYPIRYNPVNKKISQVTEITFKFVFKDDSKECVSSQNLSKYAYKTLIENIQSIVENPHEVIPKTSLKEKTDKKVSNKRSAIATPTPGILNIEQVIITNQAFSSGFQEIADWKTKKGIPAKIVTTEWIDQNYNGVDLQEKIRKFITYAFHNWGTIWFLMGGDVEVVPVRFAWISHFNDDQLIECIPQGEFIPTDWYYSCLEGNWNADGDMTFGEADWNRSNNGTFVHAGSAIDDVDLESDVFVGRVPVRDSLDLSHYKTKYFNYVKSTTNNKRNILLFSANSGGLNSNQMDLYVVPKIPFTPDREYECINTYQSFCATKQDVLNNINGSNNIDYHIICGYGHGFVTSFGACKDLIQKEEIENLTNTNTDQIIYNNHCLTMAFDKDCIAKAYLNNVHGGVAYIGNTRFGWSGDLSRLNGPFIDNLFNKRQYNIGKALFNAKNKNINNSATDGTDRWNFFTHNLYGDPEMPIWTNNPQNLNVSVSPTATLLGEVTVAVTISNLPSGDTAMICVQKGEEGYARDFAPSNGSYYFQITPDTPGEITITVTAQNFTPFETSINANATTAPNLFISNVAFDDDLNGNSYGNSDGRNDAGESIELDLQLKNTGVSLASNVTAVLSCNSSYINISTNEAYFGNILSGYNVTGRFEYSVDTLALEKSVNDQDPVTFTLEITDGNNMIYTDEFNIDIFNSQIEQGNKTILSTTNGNLVVEGGESVTCNIDLTNLGGGQTNLFATLNRDASKDTNGYITSCSSMERIYPVINQFETKTEQTPFQFSVSSSYPGGTAPLWFTLSVRNEFGKTWTYSFNLMDRPSQILLTNLGFFPNESGLQLYLKNKIQGIKGYNVYRTVCDSVGNELGNYIKLNATPVTLTYYNDNGLTKLTRYKYKISALALSGNEGILSDPIQAWANCPTSGLFPIRMAKLANFNGSFNAVDVDGDGKKEIFTGFSPSYKEGYIVGLKSDGTEMFNIDGDTSTYIGIAKEDAAITATPAIGDLNNDGNYYIATMTRDESTTGKMNYHYLHSVKDGNGDSKLDQLWRKDAVNQSCRSGIVSNVDNSIDGSLEIVCYSEGGNIRIYDFGGNLRYSFGDGLNGTYSAMAVSDLNGDGTKEIIAAQTDGIYIWSYNGTLLRKITTSDPTRQLYKSSIITADLDNDNYNEIITSVNDIVLKTATVYAYNFDGTKVSGWNGSNTLVTDNDWFTNEVSVGDLNNDGNLEVVAMGKNCIKVWNKDGSLINTITIDNPTVGTIVPILADVDGLPDLEIVVAKNAVMYYKGKIHAYKLDGTEALGFPLVEENGCIGTPCVSDINADGKNELVFGEYNYVHVYHTNGNPDWIEWGSERHDYRNTGEYLSTKPKTISGNATWNMNMDIASTVSVESGATLTISAQINVVEFSKITVNSGGTLIVDGGKLLFTNIEVQNGGSLILRNNGMIKLHRKGALKINAGATFNHQYGDVKVFNQQ